ncbi:hypothetical protein [Bifidobacterium phasiani]|uniref:Uncharacterized protein n=1 Tax=Bifidobacterium phasiani TaxID=2834431 RepID=A0ABS6WBB5_9BIFI|nr:hypothetical protein [Bifidobacterium phasiani]MBW3083814.1 hypothetical protein [Bifidobacterium phasiani]
MGAGRERFDRMLKQQASRMLVSLVDWRKAGKEYVTRDLLLKSSGLKDNELQKIIRDGNLPRHTMRIAGVKAYSVDACVRLLARWVGRYDLLVDVED